jgi:hypothetical protein
MLLSNRKTVIGLVDELDNMVERKAEMTCQDAFVNTAEQTLFQVRPYEETTYEVYRSPLVEGF